MTHTIDSDGIFCVVQAHEVESRSNLGWQLVCVVAAEQCVAAYDQEVFPGQSYAQPVTRTKVLQSPQYVMRMGTDTVVGQQAAEIASAKKATEAAEVGLKEACGKLVASTQAANTAIQDLADSRRLNDTLKAAHELHRTQLQEAHLERDKALAKLEERGGIKLTSFERLLLDAGEIKST